MITLLSIVEVFQAGFFFCSHEPDSISLKAVSNLDSEQINFELYTWTFTQQTLPKTEKKSPNNRRRVSTQEKNES